MGLVTPRAERGEVPGSPASSEHTCSHQGLGAAETDTRHPLPPPPAPCPGNPAGDAHTYTQAALTLGPRVNAGSGMEPAAPRGLEERQDGPFPRERLQFEGSQRTLFRRPSWERGKGKETRHFFLLEGENEKDKNPNPLTGCSFFFHRHFVFSLIFPPGRQERGRRERVQGK